MDIFSLSRYFWIAFVVITCVNGVVFHLRAKHAGDEDPSFAGRYATFVKGWFLWMNFPWVVMGLGNTIGGVPTFFHFLRPRDSDPWVLAWYASVAILYAVIIDYVFFRDGAEVLARLQGRSGRPPAVPLRARPL